MMILIIIMMMMMILEMIDMGAVLHASSICNNDVDEDDDGQDEDF